VPSNVAVPRSVEPVEFADAACNGWSQGCVELKTARHPTQQGADELGSQRAFAFAGGDRQTKIRSAPTEMVTSAITHPKTIHPKGWPMPPARAVRHRFGLYCRDILRAQLRIGRLIGASMAALAFVALTPVPAQAETATIYPVRPDYVPG
jgi:hypothetical protein